MLKQVLLFLCCVCFALSAIAQTPAEKSGEERQSPYDFERIEDNSFLIEEAYNQEPGVIQRISAFQYMNDHTWSYTFTEEWPVPGRKHQLSFTLPVINSEMITGLGDIELNYRYQVVLSHRVAFAPRFSLIFPTGNATTGMGSGVPGYQVNMPLSFIVSHKFVTHLNLGATYTPRIRSTAFVTDPFIPGDRPDLLNVNYGGSVIFLLATTFNFMFEVAGSSTLVMLDGKTVRTNSLLLNPGMRYAINFKSGLQIVPGVSVPVGIGASSGMYGILAYLSFEHPLWKPGSGGKSKKQ